MPWNGSGSFTRTDGTRTGATIAQQQSAAAINITDSLYDTEHQDIATGLNNARCKDGQNTPTANLPMGGFIHTGVGNAGARNQYGVVGQIQDNTYVYAAAGGGADALTATLSPAITAYANGARFYVRAAAANVTSTPTIALNGLSALTITKLGGQALVPGDIFGSGHNLLLEYNSSSGFAELLNPATVQTGIMPRSYLAGLGLARNATVTAFDTAAGAARDSTNAGDMTLAAAVTNKSLNSNWAVGSAAGVLDTGSKANSTWYHVWLIKRTDTGVVDVLASLSASAPTMPASYTLKRRIGAILTDGSGNITNFSQVGDEFLWLASVLDVNANNPGAAAVTRTLTVPTGINVWALFNGGAVNAAAAVTPDLIFSELDRNDETPSISAAPLSSIPRTVNTSGDSSVNFGRFQIRTNTSAQIRSRLAASDANCTLYIATFGWIDRRGRDT